MRPVLGRSALRRIGQRSALGRGSRNTSANIPRPGALQCRFARIGDQGAVTGLFAFADETTASQAVGRVTVRSTHHGLSWLVWNSDIRYQLQAIELRQRSLLERRLECREPLVDGLQLDDGRP